MGAEIPAENPGKTRVEAEATQKNPLAQGGPLGKTSVTAEVLLAKPGFYPVDIDGNWASVFGFPRPLPATKDSP